ncbi:MAG: efflux RND transporter periplasmic adaptor subunit [Bacteroidales bacterium]|nr:efflux RND transporter periplasmic adaptor subunit [Bacteroidales bacterium]
MKNCSILLVCAAMALAVACNGSQKSKQNTGDRVREELVETTVLRPVEVMRTIDVSTTLEGYQKMSVAPGVTGRIEHIFVDVGSRVGRGANLVRMDQQQYNTTKLTFANLALELSRLEALVASGAVSQQTLDQTRLSYDQTKESLRFLEENTFVKAQFGGVISAKNYEDGELYSGQAILELTQINTLKALMPIPESYYPQVKAGMKVDIRSDIYPDTVFPATIEIVYPTIDPATHTFNVKVRIPNSQEQLRPGMYVHTSLEMGQSTALLIPYQSVQKLTGANDRYIYLNEGGTARRIFVQIGQRFDDMIEVISDEVKEGVEVVTTGAEKLVDGCKLNVAKTY